jgi:hypothetical protein
MLTYIYIYTYILLKIYVYACVLQDILGFAQDIPKRKTWAKNLEDLMPKRRVINHFMRTSYIWLAKIPW